VVIRRANSNSRNQKIWETRNPRNGSAFSGGSFVRASPATAPRSPASWRGNSSPFSFRKGRGPVNEYLITELSRITGWTAVKLPPVGQGSNDAAKSHVEKPEITFQPPCPKCGVPMWLVRLSAFDEAHDLRTFKCQVCNDTESMAVKFE
jgi:hypothetical protein